MNTENLKSIQEENFCLKLELNSLAEILLKNESERMVLNFNRPLIEHDHKERYHFISQFTENKNVLDIACGTGYGSNYIATKGKAKSVIGGDIDVDAIRYAKHRYANEKISFQLQNAENILLENHSIDLLVSFETIEHLPNYEKFLENIKKVLKPEGMFIVSTPLSRMDIDAAPSNPYHAIEWGFESFQKVISQHFVIDKIYVQLFQNSILNNKILEEYLARRSKLTILQKIKSRLKKKILKIYDLPIYYNDPTAIQNYSKIEEYIGQYAPSDLGQKHTGYQILLCHKQ